MQTSFTYEDIEDVISTVLPGDHLVTLDLKDGFFHIPVHKDNRDLLCFRWRNHYDRWCVLPFGSNVSPYFFCKTVRCVVEHFRSIGVRIGNYVDDFIIADVSDNIDTTKNFVISELERLGWCINYEKSQLQPSSRTKFIGYIIDTAKVSDSIWLEIPKDRVNKVKRDISKVLKKGVVSARALARVIGQCISMTKAVIPAKLLLRNAYRCLKSKHSWQDVVTKNRYQST